MYRQCNSAHDQICDEVKVQIYCAWAKIRREFGKDFCQSLNMFQNTYWIFNFTEKMFQNFIFVYTGTVIGFCFCFYMCICICVWDTHKTTHNSNCNPGHRDIFEMEMVPRSNFESKNSDNCWFHIFYSTQFGFKTFFNKKTQLII